MPFPRHHQVAASPPPVEGRAIRSALRASTYAHVLKSRRQTVGRANPVVRRYHRLAILLSQIRTGSSHDRVIVTPTRSTVLSQLQPQSTPECRVGSSLVVPPYDCTMPQFAPSGDEPVNTLRHGNFPVHQQPVNRSGNTSWGSSPNRREVAPDLASQSEYGEFRTAGRNVPDA